jgi:biotin carboxyl carrier protein
MNRKEIEELIGLMRENGITELSLETPELKISLKRRAEALEAAEPARREPGETEVIEEENAALSSSPSRARSEPAPILSPVVGIFHNGGMLDPRRLLAEGDQVAEGEVLAAIESMKIPNELRAPFAGTVSRVLVKDGAPVEYGQALFLIRPEGETEHEIPAA